MTTRYFLRDEHNQIIVPTNSMFLLPLNNLDYHIEHGLFEKNIIDWCKQFCNKGTFIDIGAHTGTYSIELSSFGQVHSFEPQRWTYYGLCGSITLSNKRNITAHNIALGSPTQIGKRTLYIPSVDGGGSSLHTIDSPIQTEEVEVRTLDSYNFTNVTFMKIDVEGNELNVLLGAEQTLRHSRPKILFESNLESNGTYHNLFEIKEFLTTLNYDVIQITGVSNMFLATSIKN